MPEARYDNQAKDDAAITAFLRKMGATETEINAPQLRNMARASLIRQGQIQAGYGEDSPQNPGGQYGASVSNQASLPVSEIRARLIQRNPELANDPDRLNQLIRQSVMNPGQLILGGAGGGANMPRDWVQSIGDATGLFGRQENRGTVRGNPNRQNNGANPVRSAQEQRARSGMMQDFLEAGGGWRFDGGAGGGNMAGTPSQADELYAYNRQQQLRDQIVSMVTGQDPLMSNVMQMIQGNTGGLPAEVRADEERTIRNRNANSAANAQQGLEARLAANGGLGGIAATKAMGQLGLQANANMGNELSGLASRDAASRDSARRENVTNALALAGIGSQNRLQGAEILGRIQEPVLAGISGGGNAGGGMGGTVPFGNRSSLQNGWQGSDLYHQMLAANNSPMPQQNSGYRTGVNNQGNFNFNTGGPIQRY